MITDRHLVVLVLSIVLTASMAACKSSVSMEQSVNAVQAVSPTPAYDENGNSVKPEGWILPVTTGKKKEESTQMGKYRDGSVIRVTVLSYTLDYNKENRVIFDGPYQPGGNASLIEGVEELSVGNGRAFCFVYRVVPHQSEGMGNAMAVTSKIKLCDMDGDGKYELKGDGFRIITVPEWAK